MELFQALIVVFATSSGLVCIYTLISSYLLFTSRAKLASGDEFTKLVNALFLTVLIGFVYSLWNLLTQLQIVVLSNQLVYSFISNVLISLFFVMLAYLAFLTRQLSAKFGFRQVGQEITQYLKAAAPKKKVARKKRK
jgi:hypothetical protein